MLNDNESVRSTFAQDTKMTPGIIRIIAKIANNSLTTFKQREEASKKYRIALSKAATHHPKKNNKKNPH